MKTFQVIVSVFLIVAAIWIVAAKLRLDVPVSTYEDKHQRQQRFHAQSKPALESAITNTTGYRRTLSSVVFSGDDDIRTWTATVEFEYLNRLGGVERTNAWFAFDNYSRSISVRPVSREVFLARKHH